LTDQYELATASSSLARGMNGPAVFELFVRHLPPKRWRLLGAGLGPAVSMVGAMEFGGEELAHVRSLGFGRPFLDYLARFRFSGRIDAVPGDRASSCWSRSSRSGQLLRGETIELMIQRARSEFMALPAGPRELDEEGEVYPVAHSRRCRAALEEVDARLTR